MQKTVVKQGRGADARPAPRGKTTAPKSEELFVGIDLHKVFLQVAVVDSEGNLLLSKRVENTFDDIQKEFSQYPKGAKYVIESSSVWRAVYRFMTENMGLDVVLSNPYQTWLIAKSKKKTDKRDARALADLLKSGLIQESYVPAPEILDARDTVRFRKAVSQQRSRNKMLIQSILLQESVKIPGSPFSGQFNKKLRAMNDWRINEYLDLISACSRHIAEADAKLEGILQKSPGAQLLKTIPGVGTFTAIAVDSALGGASRFRDADAVVSYAGLAPSERSSGGDNEARPHHAHGRSDAAVGAGRGSPLARKVRARQHTHGALQEDRKAQGQGQGGGGHRGGAAAHDVPHADQRHDLRRVRPTARGKVRRARKVKARRKGRAHKVRHGQDDQGTGRRDRPAKGRARKGGRGKAMISSRSGIYAICNMRRTPRYVTASTP